MANARPFLRNTERFLAYCSFGDSGCVRVEVGEVTGALVGSGGDQMAQIVYHRDIKPALQNSTIKPHKTSVQLHRALSSRER